MVKKTFSTSPLPFRGTKRYYVRRFKEVLKNRGGQVCTVVDLFGGSGLLSRVTKDMLPAARVIYNDYDNFRQRLEHIEQTNELLDILRPLERAEISLIVNDSGSVRYAFIRVAVARYVGM